MSNLSTIEDHCQKSLDLDDYGYQLHKMSPYRKCEWFRCLVAPCQIKENCYKKIIFFNSKYIYFETRNGLSYETLQFYFIIFKLWDYIKFWTLSKQY